MKLDQEQLTAIRQFISKRGFTAIDLQLEIIDHVACRIEEKLQGDPTMSFEQALQQTHAEFGVFGFSTLEEAMARSLTKKYYTQILQEAKKWIGFPSVILLLGFGILLFKLYLIVPTTPLLITVGSINLVAIVWMFTTYIRLQKQYRKMMVIQGSNAYVFIPAIILQYWAHINSHATQSWGWAVAFSALILGITFIFATAVRIQRFAISRCQELEKLYPTLWERQIP